MEAIGAGLMAIGAYAFIYIAEIVSKTFLIYTEKANKHWFDFGRKSGL